MRTVIQELSGASAGTQFDGTAGQGLVTFTDLPLTDSEDFCPIIIGVSLENRGAEQIPTIDCYLMNSARALTTLERITVRTLSSEAGFSLHGCRIPVPRRIVVGVTPIDLTPWQLVLITTGKAAGAAFVVTYDYGRAITQPGGGA